MSASIAKRPARVQVVVFGHHLSPRTKRFLQKLGDVNVINYSLHIKRFSDIEQELFEMFELLEREYGLDTTGNVRTIFSLSGSSMASAVLPSVWRAYAGKHPELLNLILDPAQTGQHIPSPECPLIDLHSIQRRTRAQLRPRNNGVETLDAVASKPQPARA